MNPESLDDPSENGSLETFRSLFDQYYAPLCIYALRFVRDKSAANEVVQETFVRLWEQKHKIYITESVGGYLYASVRNNALNYIHREQIRNKYNRIYSEQLQQTLDYATISTENGVSVLLVKEFESKIMEAVNALPDQCKDIFMLSRFSGLKNQEIAEKKNITINTVQKQISIALDKLRKALHDYLPKVIQFFILMNAVQTVV